MDFRTWGQRLQSKAETNRRFRLLCQVARDVIFHKLASKFKGFKKWLKPANLRACTAQHADHLSPAFCCMHPGPTSKLNPSALTRIICLQGPPFKPTRQQTHAKALDLILRCLLTKQRFPKACVFVCHAGKPPRTSGRRKHLSVIQELVQIAALVHASSV